METYREQQEHREKGDTRQTNTLLAGREQDLIEMRAEWADKVSKYRETKRNSKEQETCSKDSRVFLQDKTRKLGGGGSWCCEKPLTYINN